jgi:hypothetical protein
VFSTGVGICTKQSIVQYCLCTVLLSVCSTVD